MLDLKCMHKYLDRFQFRVTINGEENVDEWYKHLEARNCRNPCLILCKFPETEGRRSTL